MSFIRTESGLSNLHLFHDADAVIFLEGGNVTHEGDMENISLMSDDIRFWQTIFDIYRPNKKYKLFSMGSKEAVKDIAKKIMEKNISTVIVAMDRDFDNLKGELLSANNIIYTCGYSWENDAFNKLVLIETFCTIVGLGRTSISKENKIIDDYYKECSSILRPAVNLDAVLSLHGDSLFDRKRYMRYLNVARNSKNIPKINTKEIDSSIIRAKEKIKKLPKKRQCECSPLIDCYGHLIAELAYRLLMYLLKRIKKPSTIQKDYINGMIVEKFKTLLENNSLPDIKKYYDSAFARVTA